METFPPTNEACPTCGQSGVVFDSDRGVFGACFICKVRWYSTEPVVILPARLVAIRDQAEDFPVVEPIHALPLHEPQRARPA